MANRLKAYVRRTILEAAREYAGGTRRTKESTESAFMDAMRGTDTGWWSDLIYTAPMLDMAHKYRRDIAAALAEYWDATGESFTYRPGYGEPDVSGEAIALALLGGPYSFAEYHAETERGRAAGAALIGLRFAVEWYAGEIARDYCPDL